MRALVYTGNGRLEIEDRPEPVPEPGEITVDVELVGICGSDILGYMGRSPGRVPPLVLGHEFVARRNGSLVAVNPLVGCGICAMCLAGKENLCLQMRLVGFHHDGALRERIAVPERNVIAINNGGRSEVVALAEPLACALHSISMVHRPESKRTLIIGFGCLGTMIATVLRRIGDRGFHIIDKAEGRCALADRFGATAIRAEDVGPARYDAIYDCAGYAATRELSCRAIAPGGDIVLVGYGQAQGGVDFTDMVRREYHMHGIMAYGASVFREAVELLQSGVLEVEGLIKIYPLEMGQLAFDEARSEKSQVIKTFLRIAGDQL